MDNSNYPHCCKYCVHGVNVPLSREVLCKHMGVIPSKSICKKYSFDPFKLKVKRIRQLDTSKFSKDDFEII